MAGEIANVLAVQTYGYIKNNHDMRPGAVGSRARIGYAEMLMGAGKISRRNLFAAFPQGFSKENPTERPDDGRFSLGESMEIYFASRPSLCEVEVRAKPMGWGTMQDVLNTYKIIDDLNIYCSARISFVSDPVHIRRVRLVWDYTHPKGWEAQFFGASFHRMTRKERWIREPISYLIYWNRLRKMKANRKE